MPKAPVSVAVKALFEAFAVFRLSMQTASAGESRAEACNFCAFKKGLQVAGLEAWVMETLRLPPKISQISYFKARNSPTLVILY